MLSACIDAGRFGILKEPDQSGGFEMASEKQRAAARKNIKKAASAAKKKRTVAHLPKKTRTALGKQANKVKRQKAAKKG